MEETLANRQIRKHTGQDKLRWGYNPQGIFTIKESYELLTEAEVQPMDETWTQLWKNKL